MGSGSTTRPAGEQDTATQTSTGDSARAEPPAGEVDAAAKGDDNEAGEWLAGGLEEAGYGYGV